MGCQTRPHLLYLNYQTKQTTLTGDNTMKKTITTKQFHKTLKNRGASKEDIKQMDNLVNEIANMLGDFKIADRFKL